MADVTSAITWTTVDYPGNVSTRLVAVSGDIMLGDWHDYPANTRGQFLYDGTQFTTLELEVPGSGEAFAWGLGDSRMQGSYFDAPTTTTKGFTFDGTAYTTVAPPGAVESQAFDASGGTVVGFYSMDFVTAHGFTFDGTTYTTLDYPGATVTSANAIDGETIVGDYSINGARRGFIFSGNNWVSLDFPGNASVRAMGVSGDRVVVQHYDYDTFAFRSWLHDGTSWMPLEFPGSVVTDVWSIDGDQIVGSYGDGAGIHGFLAVIPEPDLGRLAIWIGFGMIVARRRADWRQVSGFASLRMEKRIPNSGKSGYQLALPTLVLACVLGLARLNQAGAVDFAFYDDVAPDQATP